MYGSLSQYGNIWVSLSVWITIICVLCRKVNEIDKNHKKFMRNHKTVMRTAKMAEESQLQSTHLDIEECSNTTKHNLLMIWFLIHIHCQYIKAAFLCINNVRGLWTRQSTQCLPNTNNGATHENQPVLIWWLVNPRINNWRPSVKFFKNAKYMIKLYNAAT